MLFIPKLYYLWSRNALTRMRFSRKNTGQNVIEVQKQDQQMTVKHQANTADDLQRLQRHYHLERRLFL